MRCDRKKTQVHSSAAATSWSGPRGANEKAHFTHFKTAKLEGQHLFLALWTGICEAFPSALLVKASIVLGGLKIQLSEYHMSPTCHRLSPRVKGVMRHV